MGVQGDAVGVLAFLLGYKKEKGICAFPDGKYLDAPANEITERLDAIIEGGTDEPN